MQELKDQKLKYSTILNIVKAFYHKATNDILIGYHFRFIEDFDSHFPRIADFWQLQLTGEMDHPESKPFDIINVHLPLKIKKGEIDRWVLLFSQTLDEFIHTKKINLELKKQWMQKIVIFQKRMYKMTASTAEDREI